MTGLSGSGKSTIARALEEELVLRFGKTVQMLDGDNVRTGLNRDLGFSPADRDESVRRVGELACLFNGGGVITLVTLVSPYREARDAARKRHEEQGLKFLEVFMNVPISVVQERDPKGLYAKVASGELTGFTGMSADAPFSAASVYLGFRLRLVETGVSGRGRWGSVFWKGTDRASRLELSKVRIGYTGKRARYITENDRR